MKFYYIMANQLLTVYLSSNTLTSLHFNEQIKYCDSGVSKAALISKYRRQSTTITLAPLTLINTNMTCFMKSGKIYPFNLKWSKKPYHKNIVINDAVIKRGGGLLLENKLFRLYDSGKSYYLENKTNTSLNVNEYPVKSASPISKWSPMIINDIEYKL